jgi:transcriptional regulator with XRE-family HTH domain
MELCTRIKSARERIGLSKSELGRLVGVTPTSCISWELPSGDRNSARPSVENLAKLAIVLNVRFDWLATGRGSMTYSPGVQEETPPYAACEDFLPSDQRALLKAYLRLPARKRKALIELLEGLGAA